MFNIVYVNSTTYCPSSPQYVGILWKPDLWPIYGISAMGSRFSVYQYTKETNILFPPSIARDVMFVTGVHLDAISTSEKADQQMCDLFVSIIGRNLVIPKLYVISAMGTCFFRLRVHEGDIHPISAFNCTRCDVCNRCRSC